MEAFAQEALRGTVSDANGPLTGVMVLNKESGKWATTDLDGNYSIDGVSKGNTLEFTFMGYIAKKEV